MSDGILLERLGPVLKITNNNPKARNALQFDFTKGLVTALADASAEPGISAVVLTGAEGFFCAGGDLNVLKTRATMSVEARHEAINVLHDAIRAIRGCTKPVIASVEGGAAGAGASLALACDFVVAAEDAYFAVSYVRVGLTPDGGVTAFLAEALPRQMMNEILMLGDKIGVDQLHRYGAINRLTAKGDADATAVALGDRLHLAGADALASIKRLTAAATGSGLNAQLDLEAHLMAEAQGGPEAAEGINAFLNKRKPDFSKLRN